MIQHKKALKFSPGCWNASPIEGNLLEIHVRSVHASLLRKILLVLSMM